MNTPDFNQIASGTFLSESYPDFWKHQYFDLEAFVANNTWQPIENSFTTEEVIRLISESASQLEQMYKLGQRSVTEGMK